MRLTFISPEVWPYCPKGCLAEANYDLPLLMAENGHEVTVITLYTRPTEEEISQLELLDIKLEVPVSWRNHQALVYKRQLHRNAAVYLIHYPKLFDREGLYGNAFGDYEDNAERFIFFSRAAIKLMLALGSPPDVVQTTDWSTALVPMYLATIYKEQSFFKQTATVMLIHELAKQGIFWHYDMPLTGLGWEYYTPDYLEYFGKLNFLKAGLITSDLILTFSPSYAQEILKAAYGLEGVLQSRAEFIMGVRSGFNNQRWNCSHDPYIASNYSIDNLAGKKLCNRQLRQLLGLSEQSQRPLAAYTGLLVDEAGADILLPALEAMLDYGVDIIMAGQGDHPHQEYLQDLAQRRPNEFSLILEPEYSMLHQVLAGADILLIPDRSGPCPRFAMQAQQYGAIPVVHYVGALKDSLTLHTIEHPGTAFGFNPYTTEALLEGFAKALDCFAQSDCWHSIMKQGMGLDFSWQHQLSAFEEVYQRALALRQKGRG